MLWFVFVYYYNLLRLSSPMERIVNTRDTIRITIKRSRYDTYRDTDIKIRYLARYRVHDILCKTIQTTLPMVVLTRTVLTLRCRIYIFPGVMNYRVTFLRMRDKRKTINVQQNAKHLSCKYHGLFVNSPMVITVKSCLKHR